MALVDTLLVSLKPRFGGPATMSARCVWEQQIGTASPVPGLEVPRRQTETEHGGRGRAGLRRGCRVGAL